ncbi:hypothetical protein AGMMS50268_40240 [Spirochaetia bacterium]|nr:hypothetical protein AGMMS50268_40240 [Spirochaetia bacterium]
MKPALLVIDMQKAFYNGYGVKSMDSTAKMINRAIALYRKKNYPIIWIQNENKKDNLLRGSAGFEFIDALQPLDNEKRIIKEYANSFNKTDLAEYTAKNGIDTLIVTGYNALYCVLSTYRGAMDLDLTPMLLKNGSASDKKKNIRLVEDICNIISVGILEKFYQE